MANVVIFDEGATPERVLQYLRSVNTPEYSGRSDAVINPDLTAVSGLEVRYWKHVAGSIVPMTAQEQSDIDAAIAAALAAKEKQGAEDNFDLSASEARALRAIVRSITSELNLLRTQWRDFQAAVAAASNLNDIKTNVAALPSLADRTYPQVRQAISDEIQGE